MLAFDRYLINLRLVMQETINSFLNHLVVERGFSHNTLEAYRNDLYQFMDYMKMKKSSLNGSQN